MRVTKQITLLACAFLLTACGFHLRGHIPLPPQLRVLFLECGNQYNPLGKALASALCASGIHLVPNAKAAPVTLEIVSDNMNDNTTSIASGGQVTTYYLVYSVCFQLRDCNGKIILPPQTLTTSRTYSIASSLILANTNGLYDLHEEMRRDIVFQILNRLRAPCTLKALCNSATNN